MNEMNTRLHAAHLYFLDTCCILHNCGQENADNLFRCFKQCIRRSGLFTRYINQDDFEAMLEYSGLIKSYESGSAVWEGIGLYDHKIQATDNYFEFPQIYVNTLMRNREISDSHDIDGT